MLALRWEDIDFEGMEIRIGRSVVGAHIDATKSESSNSCLPIDSYVADTLKTWRDHAAVVNGWVFGSLVTGRPFYRDSLQADHLLPAAKACNIEGIGWHTFRHTYIDFLRQSGTQPEVQMMLMRHSDMRTTNSYGRDSGSMELKRTARTALLLTMLKGVSR